MADTSETDIPIWVDGIVKYVTGLTRRTTCDDVTYALIEQELNGDADVGAYAIFEGWRGVERPLKGRTKILKVWRAWGDERDSVVLTLRSLSDMFRFASCESLRNRRLRKPQSRDRERDRRREKNHLTSHRRDKTYQHKHYKRKDVLTSSRLYEARDPRAHGALSRELNNNTKQGSSSRSSSKESLTYAKDILRDGTNRCTKHKTNEFYDDENNNKEVVRSSRPHGGKHEQSQIIQEMVQLVLAQQQQIQDQVRRTQEVDVQIEHYENKLHQIRMRDHGRDYVQKAYIRDLRGSGESSGSNSADENRDPVKNADLQAVLFSESAAEMAAGLSGQDLEDYLNIADELLALEDRLNTKQHVIQELSMRLEEESLHDLPSGVSQCNESSLLVSPPSIHPGMNPADICWEKEKDKLAKPGHEELVDITSRLKHTCCLSRAQEQQIQEMEQQINGFDDKLNVMKEYADRLALELDESGPKDADKGDDLSETSVDNSNDSIQLNTDPRTSTPYVPSSVRQERFVEEFLASPKLKSPGPKDIPPTTQNAYTPYNSQDQEHSSKSSSMKQSPLIQQCAYTPCNSRLQECNSKSPSSEQNAQIQQNAYTSSNTVVQGCHSSLSSNSSRSNCGISSGDSTRFSLDSRESSSTSEDSTTSLVRHDVTKNSSSARMELFSTNQENTLDSDSDSDTGLSSLHSDDAVPIFETLV